MTDVNTKGMRMNAQHMDDRWKLSIDVLEQKLIAGWAYDATTPDRTVTVELLSTNGERFVCQADVFRQDLLEASIGNGRHGFEIDISTWDIVGQDLTVRPIDAETSGIFVSATFDLARALQSKPWYQQYKGLMDGLLGSM